MFCLGFVFCFVFFGSMKKDMAQAHSSVVCYKSTLSAKWILIGCCTGALANAKASLMIMNMNVNSYPVQFQLAIKCEGGNFQSLAVSLLPPVQCKHTE